MNTVQLSINKKSVTLKFGYGLLRLLGEKWNLPGINGVMKRFSVFENMTEDISFEQLDTLGDLISCAVKNNDPVLSEKFNTADAVDYLLLNPKMIEKIMLAFMASIPQPKPEPENVGKSKSQGSKKK